MRKIVIIIMGAVLIALPTHAQNFGQQTPQNDAFQSTSTMQGIGSAYSSNPTLNENGTATTPAAAPPRPNGPYKAPPLVVTEEKLKEGDTPIGDAVLPLVLLACAYFIIRATRKRKALGNE